MTTKSIAGQQSGVNEQDNGSNTDAKLTIFRESQESIVVENAHEDDGKIKCIAV